MFVDASALVAILTSEPEGPELSDRLDYSARPITSPVAVVETVLSLARQTKRDVDDIRATVTRYLDRAGIRIEGIDDTAGTLAIDAHARYGKGSGHPAGLNLGDCFAYAMARQHGVPLLYKGDDFARTDLA